MTSLLRTMWAVHTVTCDCCPSGEGRMKWCFPLFVSMQAHSPNFTPRPRRKKCKPIIKAASHTNPLEHVLTFEKRGDSLYYFELFEVSGGILLKNRFFWIIFGLWMLAVPPAEKKNHPALIRTQKLLCQTYKNYRLVLDVGELEAS